MNFSFWRIFLILFSALWLSQCQSSRKPNLVLITVDTLRADHLSSYGYGRETSPAIDNLAREGTLFLNAFAQRGQTWPSLTSILTGMYPNAHGVRENGDKLDASKKTIAELLQAEGYRTAAFLTNMQTAPNRGFDHKYLVGGNAHFNEADVDRDVTEKAMEWLKQNKHRSFFLWIHYLAPHRPYAPPAPYDTAFRKGLNVRLLNLRLRRIMLEKIDLDPEELDKIHALYDGEVLYVDSQIQVFLDHLKNLKLMDRSLVALTSDHGEDLYDHNFHFGHSPSVYDSTLKIPLILRHPGKVPAGKRVPQIVETVDIAPTLFQLLGLKRAQGFNGKDLTPLMQSEKPAGQYVAYSEIRDKIATIRTSDWRYVYNPTNFRPRMLFSQRRRDERNIYLIRHQELYSLTNHPFEKENVIGKHKDVAARMNGHLNKWWQTDKIKYEQQTPDKETLEELKALGYVQ